MTARTILLATRNRGKLAELQALLADESITLLTLDQVSTAPANVHEDGATFRDNARKKCVETARATGLPTLSDDSGLEVDALGGAPGVLSARFAGPRATDGENNRRLLSLLIDTPAAERTARFRCVLCFVDPKNMDRAEPHYEEGACEGRIVSAARGTSGFGYDPLFVPDGHEKTLAELGAEVKNAISHRAIALAKMAEWLKNGAR